MTCQPTAALVLLPTLLCSGLPKLALPPHEEGWSSQRGGDTLHTEGGMLIFLFNQVSLIQKNYFNNAA